jgi:ubiquitin-activating enzyme E1 C
VSFFRLPLHLEIEELTLSASCCNEAFKLATLAAPSLDNYMMYSGNESLYAYTFEYEKRADCPVCGGESIEVQAEKDWTLETLLEKLEDRQDL